MATDIAGGLVSSKIPAKKTYHHGNLRHALIESALALITELGPESFTLREVARRAGVSAAAPYRHFEDKSHLLATVAVEGLKKFTSELQAAITPELAGNPMAAFQAQGVAFVQFAVNHPAHFRVMNMPSLRSAKYEELLAEIDKANDVLTDAIRTSQDKGELYKTDPAMIRLAAHAMMYGLARLFVDGHMAAEDVDHTHAQPIAWALTDILAHGLAPRDPQSP